MSCKHPMHGPSTVRLGLATEQTVILRSDLFGGLTGALLDLRRPERLDDPAATAGEGAVYARLLEALDQGEVALPDEEARAEVEKIAASFDKANAYSWVSTIHDAHHALLDVLGGAGSGCAR